MLDEVLKKHLIKKGNKFTEVATMMINKITNINFRECEPSGDIKSSQNALLMLRDPNASIKFQQSQEFANNADTLSTGNPIKSLGYKLYRTFSMLREGDETSAQTPENNRLNTLA